MEHYLASSEYIDWQHPSIMHKAAALAANCATDTAIAENCFTFVRDAIRHSWDYQANPVTCKASDVLRHATGFCYAKSHLLAALLRANGIPAGLCYQRLSIGGDGSPYSLHGLNAVYLAQQGWYRIDARGNKPGVAAAFTPPVERLAFAITDAEEKDFPNILTHPLPQVVQLLTQYDTVEAVSENLPDIPEQRGLFM